MAYNSTTPTCLAALVERLGGHLESWIMDGSLQRIPHGPVSIVGNTISATFEVTPRSSNLKWYSTLTCHQRILLSAPSSVRRRVAKGCKRWSILWTKEDRRLRLWLPISRSLRTFPGGSQVRQQGGQVFSYIHYTHRVEDSMLGCIRVEFRKGVRNPKNPYEYDVLDPHVPPIVFNFNLVTPEKHSSSSALIQKRKRPAALSTQLIKSLKEIDDKQSVCMQPRKKAATEGAMAGDAAASDLAKLRRLKKDFVAKWLEDQCSSHFPYENSVESISEAKDV
ncbi:hypothetical protein DFH06DRAFT_1141067 [Mycena polygramma]|nr:hypothetical protein DFH06DRAFT_1141067 [Mycena polygramma]